MPRAVKMRLALAGTSDSGKTYPHFYSLWYDGLHDINQLTKTTIDIKKIPMTSRKLSGFSLLLYLWQFILISKIGIPMDTL